MAILSELKRNSLNAINTGGGSKRLPEMNANRKQEALKLIMQFLLDSGYSQISQNLQDVTGLKAYSDKYLSFLGAFHASCWKEAFILLKSLLSGIQEQTVKLQTLSFASKRLMVCQYIDIISGPNLTEAINFLRNKLRSEFTAGDNEEDDDLKELSLLLLTREYSYFDLKKFALEEICGFTFFHFFSLIFFH